MYSMWKIMTLNHINTALHQIHQIMFFLATSYDPFNTPRLVRNKYWISFSKYDAGRCNQYGRNVSNLQFFDHYNIDFIFLMPCHI